MVRRLRTNILNDMKQAADQELFEAIESGNPKMVAALLARHPELKTVRPLDGGTWLHLACMSDNVDVVRAVVDSGIDINSTYADSPTRPLDTAANWGCTNVARFLLVNGAIIDNEGGDRGTTLISAVTNGPKELVSLLLEHGAKVNVEYGTPPRNAMTHAIERGDKAIIRVLERAGAVLPAKKNHGKREGLRNEIIAHFEKYYGTVEEKPISEIVPSKICLSIHYAMAERPKKHVVLFTTGMSEFAMSTPPGEDEFKFAEIMVHLPYNWPITKEALSDGSLSWPIDWLRQTAHYPHGSGTWLGGAYTIISNGEPAEPLGDGTKLSCVLLLTDDSKAGRIRTKEKKLIRIYTMVPIYSEERDLEKRKGVAHLLGLFEKHGISTVVDPHRMNVALPAKG